LLTAHPLDLLDVHIVAAALAQLVAAGPELVGRQRRVGVHLGMGGMLQGVGIGVRLQGQLALGPPSMVVVRLGVRAGVGVPAGARAPRMKLTTGRGARTSLQRLLLGPLVSGPHIDYRDLRRRVLLHVLPHHALLVRLGLLLAPAREHRRFSVAQQNR